MDQPSDGPAKAPQTIAEYQDAVQASAITLSDNRPVATGSRKGVKRGEMSARQMAAESHPPKIPDSG